MPMKESESTEFKKSLAELGDGLNSVVAILNKHGAGEL
jgi:ATP-dependent DNA helicase RecG